MSWKLMKITLHHIFLRKSFGYTMFSKLFFNYLILFRLKKVYINGNKLSDIPELWAHLPKLEVCVVDFYAFMPNSCKIVIMIALFLIIVHCSTLTWPIMHCMLFPLHGTMYFWMRIRWYRKDNSLLHHLPMITRRIN